MSYKYEIVPVNLTLKSFNVAKILPFELLSQKTGSLTGIMQSIVNENIIYPKLYQKVYQQICEQTRFAY